MYHSLAEGPDALTHYKNYQIRAALIRQKQMMLNKNAQAGRLIIDRNAVQTLGQGHERNKTRMRVSQGGQEIRRSQGQRAGYVTRVILPI